MGKSNYFSAISKGTVQQKLTRAENDISIKRYPFQIEPLLFDFHIYRECAL